jgi:hypothetical protein
VDDSSSDDSDGVVDLHALESDSDGFSLDPGIHSATATAALNASRSLSRDRSSNKSSSLYMPSTHNAPGDDSATPGSQIKRLTRNLHVQSATNNQLSGTISTLQFTIKSLEDKVARMKSVEDAVRKADSDKVRLELKLKEAGYMNTKLSGSINTLKEQHVKSERQYKGMINGMRSALLAVEDAVHERAGSSRKYIKQLKDLTTSFSRHLKGGYSANGSYTSYEMLEKMGRVLGGLEDALSRCDDGITDVAARVTSNVTQSTIAAQASSEESTTVANAMTDICGELETQNSRLRREIGRLQEEVGTMRKEEDERARLLPEYRLEIVRSRGMAEEAQKELQAERNTTKQLQRRLDECIMALKNCEEDRLREATARYSQRQHDNNHYAERPRQDPFPAHDLGDNDAPVPIPSASSPPRTSAAFSNSNSNSPAARETQPQPHPQVPTTLSQDEMMFARLLQSSNERLLSDLQKSVEEKLENVVKRQTEMFLSKELSLDHGSADSSIDE